MVHSVRKYTFYELNNTIRLKGIKYLFSLSVLFVLIVCTCIFTGCKKVQTKKHSEPPKPFRCRGKEYKIFYLTPSDAEKGIAFKTKDGNYFGTKIAMCVKSSVSDDELNKDKERMLDVLKSYFHECNSKDLILKPGPVKTNDNNQDKILPGSGTQTLFNDFTEEESTDSNGLTPFKRFGILENRLGKRFKEKFDYIFEVYLWESDVIKVEQK